MDSFENTRLGIEVALGFLSAFGGVLWWIVRKLVADVRETEKDFSGYKLHVSEAYSTKSDLNKAFEQLGRSVEAVFAKLERIENKIDQKADK